MDEFDERKELIEFLKHSLSNKTSGAMHRETSAWAITVLYLSSLLIVLKTILNAKSFLSGFELSMLFGLIVFVMVLVMIFIHAQYGSSNSSRAIQTVYTEKIFNLIKRKIHPFEINLEYESEELNGSEVKRARLFKNDIDNFSKNEHKLSKIGPWVCILW